MKLVRIEAKLEPGSIVYHEMRVNSDDEVESFVGKRWPNVVSYTYRYIDDEIRKSEGKIERKGELCKIIGVFLLLIGALDILLGIWNFFSGSSLSPSIAVSLVLIALGAYLFEKGEKGVVDTHRYIDDAEIKKNGREIERKRERRKMMGMALVSMGAFVGFFGIMYSLSGNGMSPLIVASLMLIAVGAHFFSK